MTHIRRAQQGHALGPRRDYRIVHSDDFLSHARMLECVAQAFSDPSIDAVYGNLGYVAADNSERIIRRWRAGAFTPQKLRWGWMPSHPTLFFRQRVVDTFGAYDTQYRIAADYDAILRSFSGGIRATYVPKVLVKMCMEGERNRSLERILLKSREDLAALRKNKIGGIGTLALKNISKVPQFLTPS
jgi:hypothetical protein